MARHPHYDLIVEWAADTSRVVQTRLGEDYGWQDCCESPRWYSCNQYRFKPESKPNVVRYAKALCPSNYSIAFSTKKDDDNLKLTFDGETGKLKSAEVIS